MKINDIFKVRPNSQVLTILLICIIGFCAYCKTSFALDLPLLRTHYCVTYAGIGSECYDKDATIGSLGITDGAGLPDGSSAMARASWNSLGASATGVGTKSVDASAWFRDATRVTTGTYGDPGFFVPTIKFHAAWDWGGYNPVTAGATFNESLVFYLNGSHMSTTLFELYGNPGSYTGTYTPKIPITIGEWFNFTMGISAAAGGFINDDGTPGTNSMNAWDSFAIEQIRIFDIDDNELFNFTIESQSGFDYNQLVQSKPVPEPATMLLLGSGLISLVGYRRKKLFKK